jgi:hypothetical protein
MRAMGQVSKHLARERLVIYLSSFLHIVTNAQTCVSKPTKAVKKRITAKKSITSKKSTTVNKKSTVAAKKRIAAAKRLGNNEKPHVDIKMGERIVASNDDTDSDKDGEGETDSSVESKVSKGKTSDHFHGITQGPNKRQKLEPSGLSDPIKKFHSIDLSDIEEYERNDGA